MKPSTTFFVNGLSLQNYRTQKLSEIAAIEVSELTNFLNSTIGLTGYVVYLLLLPNGLTSCGIKTLKSSNWGRQQLNYYPSYNSFLRTILFKYAAMADNDKSKILIGISIQVQI